jgi:hypothetical protein
VFSNDHSFDYVFSAVSLADGFHRRVTCAAVTDSTTAVWGATATGGGTNHVLAYCDGTNWTAAGK